MDENSAPICPSTTTTKGETKNDEDSNVIISFSLPFNDNKYIITASLCSKSILFIADEALGLDQVYYKSRMTYTEFLSLNKTFKLCDSLKEIGNTLKYYIENALNGEKNYDIFLTKRNNKELRLNIKVLAIQKEYSFGIKLEKVTKEKDKLIKDLRKVIDICVKKYGKDDIFNELIKEDGPSKNILTKCSDIFWKEGNNYEINQKRLVAKKIKEDNFCTTIVGDKPLYDNCISTWKIKLQSFKGEDLRIGVGPYNLNQDKKENDKICWTFGCSDSKLYLKSKNPTKYKSNTDISLSTNDVVGVKMDMSKGELSFSINGVNFGIACKKIPTDIDIVPVVLLYGKNDSVEIIN